jgi:hypothetical protein
MSAVKFSRTLSPRFPIRPGARSAAAVSVATVTPVHKTVSATGQALRLPELEIGRCQANIHGFAPLATLSAEYPRGRQEELA